MHRQRRDLPPGRATPDRRPLLRNLSQPRRPTRPRPRWPRRPHPGRPRIGSKEPAVVQATGQTRACPATTTPRPPANQPPSPRKPRRCNRTLTCMLLRARVRPPKSIRCRLRISAPRQRPRPPEGVGTLVPGSSSNLSANHSASGSPLPTIIASRGRLSRESEVRHGDGQLRTPGHQGTGIIRKNAYCGAAEKSNLTDTGPLEPGISCATVCQFEKFPGPSRLWVPRTL